MNHVKQSLISIDHGKTERIRNRDHSKLSLVVSEGTAWITVSGDPVDYLLKAGERLEIGAHEDNLVVESISEHLELKILSAS